jgi:hypothetical protein
MATRQPRFMGAASVAQQLVQRERAPGRQWQRRLAINRLRDRSEGIGLQTRQLYRLRMEAMQPS